MWKLIRDFLVYAFLMVFFFLLIVYVVSEVMRLLGA